MARFWGRQIGGTKSDESCYNAVTLGTRGVGGLTEIDKPGAEEAASKTPLKDALAGIYGFGWLAMPLIAHHDCDWWTSIGLGLIWPLYIPHYFIGLRQHFNSLSR